MTTVLATAAASRCHDKSANLPRPKPVTVNGVTIPGATIAREAQNHPATKPIEAWLLAARALVVRELLLQEARRLGIASNRISDGEGRRETDEEALVRTLVEREIVTPVADEETCRRYFDRNRSKFSSSPLFAVRHILLVAAPKDVCGRSSAREKAARIISEVERDPGRFAALARLHSACPSRDMGGDLGQVSCGQTVPEFEQALARAPVGKVVGEPVETRFGFHVVIVDQRLDGQSLPFEIVHERIAGWLTEKAKRAAICEYISMLAGRSKISGIDLATSVKSLAG
ncbi:MAG: peptidylprolyl isomerase [Hyphomicrobiaceae bacterium]